MALAATITDLTPVIWYGYDGTGEGAIVTLQQTIKEVIRPGEQSGYVAECLEIAVVTQGETLDQLTANLREAVALHLAGEDPTTFGLAPRPTVIVTYELEPLPA